MNMFLPQDAEKQVEQSIGSNAVLPAGRACAFRFGKAVANDYLDSGRYLILMRHHHRKGDGRLLRRFRPQSGI